ncbi:hypothetical protein GGH93_002678, partial [Coemansia aciculifera]
MSFAAPGRRTQPRSGYYWDRSTLEQRRRTRLQILERDNYNAQPEFDNMPIVAEGESLKRPGRPRSDYSAPKPSTSIVVGTSEEGLKRVNRKETRQLAAQRRTFADLLAKEPDDGGSNALYLSCITAPSVGNQP